MRSKRFVVFPPVAVVTLKMAVTAVSFAVSKTDIGLVASSVVSSVPARPPFSVMGLEMAMFAVGA